MPLTIGIGVGVTMSKPLSMLQLNIWRNVLAVCGA
jgi:hypothetical protein